MRERSRRSGSQRNRAALLEAAARVLTDDPAASMDDIAARAGLGRATVYRHVANRSELLQLLGEEALATARAAIHDARPDEGPPLAALRRVLTALAAEASGFSTLLSLGMGAGAGHAADRAAALAPVTRLLQAARDAGELRPDLDPAWATTALLTLLRTAVAEGRPDPGRLAWESLGEGWLARP